MAYSFKSILVPVDFSINTEVAVKKALDLADPFATIHLLHVRGLESSTPLLFSHTPAQDHTSVIQKLNQWKQSIEESLKDIQVEISICKEGPVQECIENKARELHVDLIVIGKNSHHTVMPFLSTVSPSKLAANTGIAVLTAKPGAIYNRIRTMVVPLASETTKHKLEMVSAICKKFSIKVHLVTFINKDNQPMDFYASSLLQAYQWLKTVTHCQVEYSVLHGENKAKALLQFAEKINADVLLVHPETETRIGWLNKHISDILPASSKIEILAIQPEPAYVP